jgi:hypothetical protein
MGKPTLIVEASDGSIHCQGIHKMAYILRNVYITGLFIRPMGIEIGGRSKKVLQFRSVEDNFRSYCTDWYKIKYSAHKETHCAGHGSKTSVCLEMDDQTTDFIGEHLEKWKAGSKYTVITQNLM